MYSKKCFTLWTYFQYPSSHFLASFECLWWFFQNCFTFLDGLHCIICKLRKTFAEEVVEFFLCLRAFENASFFIRSVGLLCTIQVRKRERKKNRSPHSKVERYLEGENRTQVNKVLFMSCGLDMQFSDSCSSLLSRADCAAAAKLRHGGSRSMAKGSIYQQVSFIMLGEICSSSLCFFPSGHE